MNLDAHWHDAKEFLELFGRKEGVALALDVVDAGPVGGQPNFSNNGRTVGGKDESVGSVSEEAPKDLRKAYRAILIEAPCCRKKFIDVHQPARLKVTRGQPHDGAQVGQVPPLRKRSIAFNSMKEKPLLLKTKWVWALLESGADFGEGPQAVGEGWGRVWAHR